MINEQQYVTLSIELHIFFGRTMKEHSLFLEAGFTPRNADFSKKADQFKVQFESILHTAVKLGNGIVSPKVLSSGEFFTEHTLRSEQKTQALTGIRINQNITRLESNITGNATPQITPALVKQVMQLNMKTRSLLDGLIDFKTEVLNNVLSCRMFTVNYPLLIEHILHEAKMYRSHLITLENNQNPDSKLKETELFWDKVMMQHALFIRGFLDPTENTLIVTSNNFANNYANLIQEAKSATDMTILSITNKTLQETLKYRDFKEAGTKGIMECKIRSIILPLLADHVLREANHYIRLIS